MSDVTRILSQIESGDPSAAEQLLPLVYDELRKLAAAKLAHEKPGQTLQATALVHDAYLRLVDTEKPLRWNSRGHFFGAAAEAMRRIVVDQARHKASVKHGGGLQRVELSDPPANDDAERELLALDAALPQLAAEDPLAAEVVKLKYFAGLRREEIAAALGVSVLEIRQKWKMKRIHQFRAAGGVGAGQGVQAKSLEEPRRHQIGHGHLSVGLARQGHRAKRQRKTTKIRGGFFVPFERGVCHACDRGFAYAGATVAPPGDTRRAAGGPEHGGIATSPGDAGRRGRRRSLL